jgi:membrane-bound lytic murein transglycosylase D
VSEIKIELSEPVGAAGKLSWIEYQSGAKALEEEDLLTAMQFFDLALNAVHSEQQADSLKLPEDAFYYSVMPSRIILVLESLYPRLASLAESEQDLSMRNDYEDYEIFDYELLDSFEETPIDSAEKMAIKHFLDTIDFSKFSLPVVINERVMQEIHYLTVNARTFTEGSLSRKTLLDSMIFSKIRERGMPEDLIYLAFIESGFKVSAYSRAKAAGVWQFIPGTGKRYGLPSDFWLDMRRNPEAATDAALSYLSDLYDEFGDWHLAMAAYNCGEGRIRRLVKEKLAEDPSLKKVSYWNLKLPRETMHYVPRILAATIIGRFPEHYSFDVQKQSLIASDTVTIKDCLPLDKIGAAVGVSVHAIRDLNPELVRWCTPPNLKSYTMRVPEGSREKFLAAYAKMDKTQLVRWQQYKVQKGDNLGHISRLFGLRVADIQAANNLKNTKLRVGQIIIIPMPAGANPPKQNQRIEKSENLAKPSNINNNDNNARTYVVRKGDNLSSISRRFGLSSQNLQAWNNLQGNKIMVGQRLYLQDPAKKDTKKNEIANTASASRNVSANASYTIKAGDNLWEIARIHNVTVQQLLNWNPGLDQKIYPGMRIKVKE